MPKKTLKAGVIGLGMGQGHVRGLQNHPEVEVVAVADLSQERLDKVKAEYNVPRTYKEGEEMIRKEDLDIVGIATPNFLHAPLSIKALKAGAHVFCEKPMAINVREAEQMEKTAREKKKVLMIDFSYRFSDLSLALREQVRTGVIGTPYYARTVWHRRKFFPGFGGWFGQKKLSGGGPLIDLGVHRIDLALWLMGSPRPLSVLGVTYDKLVKDMTKGKKSKFDCEDLALGMIKLENGITMLVEISWGLHGKNDEYMRTEIYGTKGSVVQKNIEQGYKFEGWVYTEEAGAMYDKKLARTTVKAPGAYENFVDVIKGRAKENFGSAADGVAIQRILNGMYESAEKGKEIKFR
ncbi:Gfo/Idh/MocA family protein [Planctomycetota bacterium]